MVLLQLCIKIFWPTFRNRQFVMINMKHPLSKLIPLCAVVSLSSFPGFAQLNRGNDTTYYEYFPGSVTTRLYVSQKYTDFTLKSKDAKDLRYQPNTTFNLGIGATYHNFSLNLAYGFGFLNKDDSKGDTKYLDLQGHFYTPKLVIDFYGQNYKGYHLADGFAAPPGNEYYYRHDAKVNFYGLSLYHVFNGKRFSYRAAFIQNEWQKKSAGTFLAGAEIYYGVMKADSAWVPQTLKNGYTQSSFNKINYTGIGPGIGYAYSLVLFQHLFLTGSVTGNANVGITYEYKGDTKNNHFAVNPFVRYRAAAGYNGRVWNVSANWIADYLPFRGEDSESKYVMQTGNYRVIIAKRLFPGPKLKKPLKVVDAIFKE